MSEIELFFNKLGVKLISEGIRLTDLNEEEINVYFIDKNNYVSLDMKVIEKFDKELLDGLILSYGGLGAMVKLECLISDVIAAQKKFGDTVASSN